MTDLSEFLLARIAEDEEVAKRASGDRLRRMSQADDTIIADAGFMQTFTTARVLAECEAKRRVVKEHAEADPCDHAYDTSLMGWMCVTLRLLALPYTDHPGFREEWRP